MSHVSVEEDKINLSETSSVASAKKSTSSLQKKVSAAEKLAKKYAKKYDIGDDKMIDES